MWELSIDTASLDAAATAYGTAAASYSKALSDVEGKLNSALSLWDDASSATWTEKVKEAKTKMEKVGERMTQNAAVLAEIAKAAGETEGNVKQGISSL